MRLWAECPQVTSDEEVMTWLGAHSIDPAAVAALDLARALPRDRPLPEWARYGIMPWNEGGYRVLVPLFDLEGRMAGLYARSLRPKFNGYWPRSYPPVSDPHGFVMGNASALELLRNRSWQEDSSWRTIVISGGAADFLDWASASALTPAAIFGIVPGSWSRHFANRIPDGCRVIVRAFENPITGRYAHRLSEALTPRCEVIVRTAS